MRLFSLIAVFVWLSSLASVSYSQVPAWEREALIAIYNATDGENWSGYSSWTPWMGAAGTECDWWGVSCSNGSVTGLNLSYYNVSGFLPPELGNLSNLINLTLGIEAYGSTACDTDIAACAKLTGSIPPELGNLTKLEKLIIRRTQLSGPIPAELGNLTNLTVLTLSWNQLSGSIPPELGDLSNLTDLGLYGNQLTGPIPPELGNLTIVTNFNLESNQLSGTIPPELGNIATYNNNIVTRRLVLNDNQLSGTIPPELGNLSYLDYLYLDNNQLSGSIPPELGNLSRLDHLYLNNNQLTGSIPAELGNLSSLDYLYLNNNQLTGSIPAELGNLSSLNYVYLNDNQLSGSIPPAWAEGEIDAIDLSNNPKLDRNILLKLYTSTYALNWTNKTGWGGAVGTECDWYGVTCTGGDLTGLNLASNNLVGTIPSELGNFVNLTSLDLSSNTLTGSIPTELGNLTTLTSLDLSTNFLEGPLPQWLSDMGISNLNVTDAFTAIPVVAISGGNRTIADTDGVAGESVSFTGTASDSDGTIASTQWLVDGSEVATGLTATIALPNGSTVVTFKATDNDSASSTTTVTITVNVPVAPTVTISGGNRTISDTDNAAGETVSLTGTATDSDGTIATTQWLVGGSVVATGSTPSIALRNGSTVVTFKATDNVGLSTTTAITITITAPSYIVTDEWPSPYNGVTPDSSLGLAFNNIGIYDAAGSTIYTCLRIFTDGLPGSASGISEFDIGLTIVSLDEGTVQITSFREFNVIGALNENVELPDCSGKFETTTAVFTDTIETKSYFNFLGNLLPIVKTFETTFDLIDGDNLILKLSSYQELTAD